MFTWTEIGPLQRILNGDSFRKEQKLALSQLVQREQLVFGGTAWTGVHQSYDILDHMESIEIGRHFLFDYFKPKSKEKTSYEVDTLFSSAPALTSVLSNLYGEYVFQGASV